MANAILAERLVRMAVLGIAVALAGAGAAIAQEPPAAVVKEPGDKAERLRLAERMNIATGAEALIRAGMKAQIGALGAMFRAGNDARVDDVNRIVSEELQAAFEPTIPLMLEFNRDQLAAAYSAADLAEMLRFFESDVGKRMVAAQPGLQAAGVAFGAQLGAAAAQQALPRIIDRLRAASLAVPNTL
jgi:hypothetical protein